MGVVIKADKDWRGVGWPQVAMHFQLSRFLVSFVLMQIVFQQARLQYGTARRVINLVDCGTVTDCITYGQIA